MLARLVTLTWLALAASRVLAQDTSGPASHDDIDRVRELLVAIGCVLAYGLGFIGGNHE